MERTNKPATVNEGRCKWMKKGGGSLRIGKRIIKPNESFYAFPDEIPAAFRDQVALLEGQEENPKAPMVVEGKIKYKKVKRETDSDGTILYDIIDSQKKVVNQKPLEKEEADKLLTDLNS